MTYRLLDHTADLGIEVDADTLENLFAECLRAQTDCWTRLQRVEQLETRDIDLTAPELSVLLVEFLQETIFLHETEGLVFAAGELAVVEGASGWSVRGEISGERFELARHGLKTLLKAVTYHGLEVRATVDGWQARVIFDI